MVWWNSSSRALTASLPKKVNIKSSKWKLDCVISQAMFVAFPTFYGNMRNIFNNSTILREIAHIERFISIWDLIPKILVSVMKNVLAERLAFASGPTCCRAVLCVGVGVDSAAQLFCQRNGFAVMDGIGGTVQVSACCWIPALNTFLRAQQSHCAVRLEPGTWLVSAPRRSLHANYPTDLPRGASKARK